MIKKIKAFYDLTKPGIIRGNLMTAVAGFLLASKNDIDIGSLVAVLAGISLIIGSGCVINNYIDRDIDKKMVRTKNRALVTGEISASRALSFAAVIGILGFAILLLWTNLLTFLIGLAGIFAYVVLYSIYKRRSTYGTLVGSISGAMSLVAGYCSVTNRLDSGAVILFLIMALWQMPHFYAIAVYRLKDYAAAGVPVLPVVYGVRSTKVSIFAYIVAFIMAIIALYAFGYTGYFYLIVMVTVSIFWLRLARTGFNAKNDEIWGQKVFGFSLIVLLVFCLMISLNIVLP